MKSLKHIKLLILLTAIQTSIGLQVNGQQFKWVRGGGSPESIVIGSTPSAQYIEGAYFICTDPNGNVYALNVVGNDPPITADTFSMPAGGYGANNNLLLTSYNCNGQMRWAKFIGSIDQNFPYGIRCDALGHIYVAGTFFHLHSPIYIGYDTTISAAAYYGVGLIQYDTTGHFNWLRYVGQNTFAAVSELGNLYDPIAIDGVNNVHYFCYMKAGVDLTYTTSVDGVYDLSYSPSGLYLSATRLNMGPEWFLHGAAIDPLTNKLYVCGEIKQGYFGGSAVDTFYAAAFDASRNQIWWHMCGSGGDDGLEAIAFDKNTKQLYFSGNAQPVTGTTTFSFNGYSGSAPGYDDISVLMKTDSNGTVKWIKHYDSHTSVNYFSSVTMLGSGKVAAAGGYAGSVTNGTTTISVPAGGSYNPFFVITDTAGNLITMQQLPCDGSGDVSSAWALASDQLGNLYIGGSVEDSVFGGTIPAYHTVGGNTDFFVAKYGYDCACTSTSVTATYSTSIIGGDTVTFTYTGSSTALDSVRWNFGDGYQGTGTPTTHIYGATNTYTVCVTAYTGCGNATYCTTVHVTVPTNIVTEQAGSNITVYPNPVKDELVVTGLSEATDYRLRSPSGISLQHGGIPSENSNIPLIGYPPGIYFLEITKHTGERQTLKIIKE